MSLVPGTRLGPYEIQTALGSGGMGEVYRARDTRLDRAVAVKVLPDSFATDPERLRRFEQEAKTVAALNHPNILSVHDIGVENGTRYIVTELLEGQTVREKLEHGAPSFRRAIDYGLQIARGLAAAHEKGVVHRDLKPENLFVTQDGRVKILDFGLARQNPIASNGTRDVATLDTPLTTPGLVLGTVGYMSPEQVRGEVLDHRTDIFSFGAVLYEMLSGQRAFKRDTTAETMTAILKEEPPDFDQTAVPVPVQVEKTMRRCLEKAREERFQSAKDMGFALEALSGTSHPTATQPALSATRGRWLKAALAIFALLAILIAAYFAGTRGRSSPAHFEEVTFQRGYIKGARFTPDGQNAIYSAAWEGRPYEVFTTRVGDRNARSLDLKNAMVVGVSAAGDMAVLTDVQLVRSTKWMQFGMLARASVGGGAPREILEDVYDADISRDGKQFAVVRRVSGPLQLEYPIGKVLYKTNGYISHPRISPDGKQVAFLDHPIFGDDRGYVAVADAGGNVRRLTGESAGEEGLAWSANGYEIWFGSSDDKELAQERAVFAVTTAGKLRKVFEVPGDISVWDIAGDGRLLFTHEAMTSALMVASPASAPERNVSVLGYGLFGVISRDGKAVAFTESGHGVPSDYLSFYRRLDGAQAVEIGEGGSQGLTPDGKFVVADVASQPTFLRILPTGAGEARTFDIAPVHVDRGLVSWMPGGKEFVFQGHEGEAPPRAYRASLDGGAARPLTNQTGAQYWSRVSPDGKFVLQAVGAGMGGGGNVIVELATGKARPAPIQDGEIPIDWEQDGRHVFVGRERNDGATIFRVDVFSGRRDVWKQIKPADPAGMLSLSHFSVTPSGNAYAYDAGRILSTLFVYSQK